MLINFAIKQKVTNFAQMNSLIEHIEYLALSNDCVVIPGWGAFITQYAYSSYNSGEGIFCKPCRKISFNSSVMHNDGLLANSLAKRDQISYQEAVKAIERNVTIYKQLLAEGTEIPFGRLGYFATTQEGQLEFIPFHQEQQHDTFFGLQSFSFPTLEERIKQDEIKETANDVETVETGDTSDNSSEEPVRHNWFSKKAIQIAASIIVLLGLTFVLTTPVFVNKNNQELASLNVPEVKKAPSKTLTASTTLSESTIQKDSNIKVQGETQLEQPTTVNTPAKNASEKDYNAIQTANQTQMQPETKRGKYCLVVCTLFTKTQVQQFFAYHKDIDQNNVVYLKGRYLVYYSTSDSYQELLKEAQALPKQYKQYYIAG